MEQTAQEKQYHIMTTTPIPKLVCAMAVPSIISMLISAFYNMADTFFIGKISTEATAAVGVVFSYMTIIQAVAFFFGHGGGSYISRELGRQNRKNAQMMASNSLLYALLVGLCFVVVGFVAMHPFLRFLGATESFMAETVSYFRFILLATPFTMGSFVLNNLMRMQGNAKRGTIGIATGALLNVALDPLFIFGFDLGVSGAAIATAISQTVGFVVLLCLSSTGGGVPIRLRDFTPRIRILREIAAGGFPSLCRQGLASISAVCLNQVAGLYGAAAIAAFSIVSRVFMMAFSALLGFGQGFQPVCGFNFGAGLYDRVKQAFWFCVKISTVVLLFFGAGMVLFSTEIIAIFRADDAQLLTIASKALRYQGLVFPLMGWLTIVNMFLQNIRATVPATIVAAARQGIVFLPVLFFMVWQFGLTGLQLAQPIADVGAFLLSIPLGLTALKRMAQLPTQMDIT